MREWKRIFVNPLWILGLVLLVGINILSFFVQQKEQASTTLAQKNNYILEYDSWLNGISEKAELMQKVSVFNEPDSFEFRNIIRTAQDFRRMEGRQLQITNNDIIHFWFQDGYSQLTGFIMVVITVIILMEERQNKMRATIGATIRGRFNLALCRVGALIVSAVLCSLLFNIIRIGLSCLYFGDLPDLSALIQSIELYKYISFPMNIMNFIGLNLLAQILGNVFWGYLLWFVLCLPFEVRVNVLIVGIMAAIEYFFCSFLSIHKIFTRYLNLNILGYPINERSFTFFLLPILVIGLIILVLFQQSMSNYERSQRYIEEKKEIKLSWKSKKLLRMEGYKLGVINYGFLLSILFAVYYFSKIELPIMALDNSELLEIQYYKVYDGAVSGEIENVLEEERQRCQQEYDLLIQQVSEGQLLSEHEIQSKKDRLIAIEKITQKNQLLIKQGSTNTRLIGPYAYENAYGVRGLVYRMKMFLVATFFMILLIVPVMGYEKQRGIDKFLQTIQNGRAEIFKIKVITVCISCIMVWLFITVKEWYDIQKIWGGLKGLTSDAFSLTGWKQGIQSGQIWVYVAVMYLNRLLGMLCGGMLIFALSLVSHTYVKSVILSVSILLLPTIAELLFSTEEWGYLSYIGALSQIDLYPNLLKMGLFVLIGGTAGYLTYVQWRRYKI